MNPKERLPNQQAIDQLKDGSVKFKEPTPDQFQASLKMNQETETVPQSFEEPDRQPMTIMSENDAYIAERMKSQPRYLDEIEVKTREEKSGQHRLSLPDYFEEFSFVLDSDAVAFFMQ